ncbi:3'-5' exonuclease [Thermoflavimicrobium daqui]|jgi:inhibitor of KinA sporulation pathway (predicted exonuclease)|uniref:Exonuclease n=1 Tax=Thermoflavimicrobium daqui TaxID=2137476 RepID=A0A364K6C5_9BACL|nr:3'-5' exonuclease [Thermoflavimicrobium daqui]RAL25837.1 exonuclease [Thermoflavimicrobium daqui]
MNHLLIIDLESTCYERKSEQPPHFISEIIEVGAVILDIERLKIVREYQRFVKPTRFPILSGFCKQLTSISQEQVDQGQDLKTVCKELNQLQNETVSIFCSWGYYDKKQFVHACTSSQVPYPFQSDHFSLKHEHASFYQLRRPLGMKGALMHHDLPLDGTHHRGIDDARNIAKIAIRMIQEGWQVPMSLTQK